MATPFIGEIRSFGFSFAPIGWAACNGQTLSIQQNLALFSILGTTYGGNGTTTFVLPDLRGRLAVHSGSGIVQGEVGGAETVTLTPATLAAHSHNILASADLVTDASPAGNVMGAKGRGGVNVFAAASNLTPLAPNAVSTVGGGQPHDNLQPFLVVNFCIALQGIFPSRN